MTRAARVDAPAKINAFLRVGPRLASGYHDLVTLFVQLDLADSVVVHVGGSSRSLDCSGDRMPPGGLGPVEKNLAYRAALAYSQRAGWPTGFSIELTKRIPVGGGLGGGSSDAAAVLKALNALAPTSLSPNALVELGASLGSDVPFFVAGQPFALGAGRGDRLRPIDPLPERAVILAIPAFGVGTADAYSWLDEDRPDAALIGVDTIRPDDLSSWERLAGAPFSGNDFEAPVERRHPLLRVLREIISDAGATISRLSGSGSTVFGIVPGSDLAVGTSADVHFMGAKTSARVVQVEVLQ